MNILYLNFNKLIKKLSPPKQNVYRLSISKFDYETTILIEKKLNGIKTKNCEALFLEISGYKSSITSSIAISDMIIDFKNSNKIPVYSFAGEIVGGPAIIPLLSGDEVFIDKSSIVGMLDLTGRYNFLSKFLKDNNYKFNMVRSGKDKTRMNPFEDSKSEDKEWISSLLKEYRRILIEKVEELRGNKLVKSISDIENLSGSTLIKYSDAVKYGIVDGIKTLDEYRLENYPKKKCLQAKISSLEAVKSFSTSFDNEFSGSSGSFKGGFDAMVDLADEINAEYVQYVLDNSVRADYI